MSIEMTSSEPPAPTDGELREFLGVRGPEAPGSDPSWAGPDQYPRMFNLSAGFVYGRSILCAVQPTIPEYVTIPVRGRNIELEVDMAEWNMLWETAQFRRRLFDESAMLPVMAKVADLGDHNVVFVPRTDTRYFEYEILYHLLPRATVERFGLPLVRAGQWPYTARLGIEQHLPRDFAERLTAAWGSHIWRHLCSGSPESAFSSDDPIRVLAHNLDFWVPPATAAVQEIMYTFPVVGGDPMETEPVRLEDGSYLEGAVIATPRVGMDIWEGEVEAGYVTEDVIGEADRDGRLRGIVDAVRSNRIEDDFSERWSYAREDFERKLYRKRSKVKVRFVELTDTIPVQGPESEIVGNTVTSDFLALLNEKDRSIVVLLNSGHTKLTEVADLLGYANHSAVSKRLARIRRQAAEFFD